MLRQCMFSVVAVLLTAGVGWAQGGEQDATVKLVDPARGLVVITVKADNGIRIKSNSTRGGVVRKVVYTNVCIRNVKEPLVFDPFYSKERGTDAKDSHIPQTGKPQWPT